MLQSPVSIIFQIKLTVLFHLKRFWQFGNLTSGDNKITPEVREFTSKEWSVWDNIYDAGNTLCNTKSSESVHKRKTFDVLRLYVVRVQALQEEQAEEMKAKELEKQLAMMELDPSHLIAYVATQHPLYLLEQHTSVQAPAAAPATVPPAQRGGGAPVTRC